MGKASYSIAELSEVTKTNPLFQDAFANLEQDIINKCNQDWAPKTNGYLTPDASQYGRTTIIPALFNDHNQVVGATMATWRQTFLLAGIGAVAPYMTGAGAGGVLAEDWKVAWAGIALPNDTQMLSEIKWLIGDARYGRLDIEEIKNYKCPAIIFDKGEIIDGKTMFQMDAFIEGPAPAWGVNPPTTFAQKLVMLGSAYYKQSDRALSAPGAAIPTV